MPKIGKGLTPPRPVKHATLTEAVRWNAQMTCANPQCPKDRAPRHQMYPYCRRCAQVYRKYGDPNAGFIGRTYFKQYEPQVAQLIELNKNKDSWTMVERFFEAFGAGRVLKGSHEFYSVPLQCATNENFKPDLIVIRLGAMVALDEMQEKKTFLANRHRNHLIGSHLLKMCGIDMQGRKANGRSRLNEGAQARRNIAIGEAVWKDIGLYLLNIARTLKRQESERRRAVETLLEDLDT